ncbi:MAG: hypothetical protein ACRYFZ_09905 [Janthinobacterium lividum]
MPAERPVSLPSLPSGRFFGLLSLGVVAACAGYAALVLQTVTGPGALALRTTYPYDWAARSYTVVEFLGLRTGLWVLAAGAALLGVLLAAPAAGRRELAALGREVAGAGRGLGAGWRALPPAHRRLAAAGLLGLGLLRAYLSGVVQPYDDATSYELFVRESLLTVSAVYELPNNHVLSNTLSWLFYQVYPGFWWTMRLPVLLTSTAATAFWFLALLRRSSFWVALRAVGWFGLLNLSFYYAATGRGYWLLVALGGVGFFALLELVPVLPGDVPRPKRVRAAWAALVLAGVLGLYTVPTHALFLASAYSWLGLCAVRQRAGGRLLVLGAMGSLTLLGAALLYAPLLLLSGPQLLLHNPFVRALSAPEFWQTLATDLRVAHHLVDVPLVLGVLGGFGYLGWRARTGRLPAQLGRLVAQLGGPSTWLVLLPYGLAAVLLLPLPERTLFYKAQYLLLLASLLAEWAIGRARSPQARRYVGGGLLAGTLLLAGSQLWQVQRQEALWQHSWRWQLGAPAADWLATQPAGPVLAPGPYQCLVLRFYAHTAHRGRPWQIDRAPRPGVRYRYLVRQPGEVSPGVKLAFKNALLVVAVVP